MRQKKRAQSEFQATDGNEMMKNMATSNPTSDVSRPNYNTATLNSILMHNTTSPNSTDQTNPKVLQNGKKVNLMMMMSSG